MAYSSGLLKLKNRPGALISSSFASYLAAQWTQIRLGYAAFRDGSDPSRSPAF